MRAVKVILEFELPEEYFHFNGGVNEDMVARDFPTLIENNLQTMEAFVPKFRKENLQ